jgi:uncharacterized membrane protein (UPF0127 family)
MPVKDGDIYTLAIGSTGKTIQVECSTTPQALKQGLSGRASLPEGTGMLFIFPDLIKHSMWMPNMKFPLDVVWLDEQLSVVHISYDLQPCESNGSCPSTSSVYSTLYAIEVNAGDATRYGFELGQLLKVLG